jgi:hypothetical protein
VSMNGGLNITTDAQFLKEYMSQAGMVVGQGLSWDAAGPGSQMVPG